jgi:GNAT superfamily N-acetyltransferase
MKIRQFKEEDKDEVKLIVSAGLMEIFNVNYATELEDLENIEKEYGAFFVADKEGKIVGTLGIRNLGEEARIQRVYVKKSERGKGIGKKLMKKALDFCKKKKFKRVLITTYPEMNVSDFYGKFGFKEFRRDSKIWMEKIF